MNERFSRNLPALSPEEQQRLAGSTVCVVGCGGLGGYLIEHLSRIGVGAITVIDGDCFEPSNLNRQLLCTVSKLGTPKAAAAAERIRSIDPDIRVRAETAFLREENAAALLQGADLVLDALDNADARSVLASACRERYLPLIHGAIRGWNAQIAVCMPEGPALEQLYRDGIVSEDKSCLSFTPALCASIQCAEAVKLLIGRETALESRLLLADLRYMDFEIITLSQHS